MIRGHSRSLGFWVLSCALLVFVKSYTPWNDEHLVVNTPFGPIKGKAINSTRVFRGIPYAAPPIGDLRFVAPRAHPGWGSSPLNTTDFGATCPQIGGWNTIVDKQLSEDCLFMNIYTPFPSAERNFKIPVMVYLHAGEFRYGASNDRENNFPYFSNEVILVTFNNRIGALGFLASEALRTISGDNSTGNLGLKDQRFALQWVKENIEEFGGDPANITIFGESSGGTCVAAHLTNPKSYGLFHRAVLESPGLYQQKKLSEAEINYGYTLSALAGERSPGCDFKSPKTFKCYYGTYMYSKQPKHVIKTASRQEAKKACSEFSWCVAFYIEADIGQTSLYNTATSLYDGKLYGSDYAMTHTVCTAEGATDILKQLECLRRAKASLLVNVTDGVPFDDNFNTDGFAPVIDGVDSTDSIRQAIIKGEFAPGVPVLVGTNLDEGTEFMELCPDIECSATVTDFEKWTDQMYGNSSSRLVAMIYEALPLERPLPMCEASGGAIIPANQSYWYNTAMRSATDYGLTCPVRRLMRRLAETSHHVFGYFFTRTPVMSANFASTSTMGAFHGAEVPFVFGDRFEITGEDEQLLASRMGCYWKNFAATGNPTINSGHCGLAELPTWPRYKFGSQVDPKDVEILLRLDVGPQLETIQHLHEDQCDIFDACAAVDATLYPHF
ncbi:hypothetical protein AAMO2058_001112900 [Amorphochlora amoebiformis]